VTLAREVARMAWEVREYDYILRTDAGIESRYEIIIGGIFGGILFLKQQYPID
jgi:hypothetical protein